MSSGAEAPTGQAHDQVGYAERDWYYGPTNL